MLVPASEIMETKKKKKRKINNRQAKTNTNSQRHRQGQIMIESERERHADRERKRERERNSAGLTTGGAHEQETDRNRTMLINNRGSKADIIRSKKDRDNRQQIKYSGSS